MREVTIAAIQMSCSRDVKENIEKAAKLIRAAAEAGAQIILPSELFERQYFCQERRYDYYDYAKPLSENDAVQSMKALAKELEVVIPVSFYEAGEGRQLFNSVAVSGDRCRRRGTWNIQKDTYPGRSLLSGKVLLHTGKYRL